MRKRTTGRVFLVGAGPGNPDLLTLRAAKLLAEADTIVHDRLIHAGVLAHARPGARLVFVGKTGGGDSVPQGETNELIVAQARLGRMVVRLKSGDPFVFGRGGEEALALEAAGVPYEVVPGVSSGLGATASAAIPVTHRGLASSVTFATARLGEGEPNWAFLAQAETLVLFMARDNLGESTRALIEAGRSCRTPSALIEAGTWEHQRVVDGDLASIVLRARRANVGSPALLVSGAVVGIRSQLMSLARQHPQVSISRRTRRGSPR